MFHDLRFATRLLISRPWFSLAVVLTLALGIGINTTVFTLVNAVLFKPVPIPGGERIVTVGSYRPSDPKQRAGLSWPAYLALRNETRSFEGLEAAAFAQMVMSEAERPPERFQVMRVTPGMFTLLRTPPVLGRGFNPNDGEAGAPAVVLLGHHVWQSRYHGASDVVGRSIRLNGSQATIAGVMPPGFKFPSTQDMWMALQPTADLQDPANRQLTLFGLVQPGTSVAAAHHEAGLITSRLIASLPDKHEDFALQVRTFHDTYNGDQIRIVFLMMLGAVGFVLLIACANVANMMLSRAIERTREFTIRTAVGATRGQLIRQLLTESVLLSTLGGLLGLGITAFGVHAFDLASRDVGKPYWVQFAVDYRVFVYFAAISIATGIIFGLAPALRASKVDVNSALKDAAPAGSIAGGRLTGLLVILQFALTVVLLASAGMMIRSFFAAQALNPFVDAESVLTARIQLPEGKGERYETSESRTQFYDRLLPRLVALPGVTHAGVTNFLPAMGSAVRDVEIDGRPVTDPKLLPKASLVVQSPGYLEAIGLPLLMGRGFETRDGREGQEVAVVTRAFAATHWPRESALERRFRLIQDGKPGPWITVVGVSADLVQDAQRQDAPPLFFLAYPQEPWGWNGLIVRTSGDPSALANSLRSAVQGLDEDLALFELNTLPAALDRQRWFLRVFGVMFLVFALSGLLMASVGIYAVAAQSTHRRTREIGIRMALGATSRNVLQLVLARGLGQLGWGLAVGLAGAIAATHLMGQIGLLLQVSPRDPVVFAGIAGLLLTIGLLACWLPARRAIGINPTEALRTS